MKKTIKTIYAFLAGIVTVIISVFLFNRNKKQVNDDLANKIVDNTKQHEEIEVKVKQVEKQREEVKNAIVTEEAVIKEIKVAKANIVVEEAKTVEEAKENIIKKTRRPKRKK
jgi:hypothetical protein